MRPLREIKRQSSLICGQLTFTACKNSSFGFSLVSLFPALFMTAVCSTYIVMAPEGFGLSAAVGYPVGGCAVLLAAGVFSRWRMGYEKAQRLGR